ncbi:Rieske [2Fe-2S] iron-sulfur domain-containing protein [Ilyonectria destructans]|nr:Rieske [2Fe-2S] iron-sulfur domain-containing protein [Ilyonectria destructans]
MFRLFSQTATEEVPRALPSSWYREPAMYELERRAIFSKRWLLITHRSRFTKPGDYVRYDEAGFSFFLCLDRQGNLNGFHNICRHRAFPIVTEEKGNVSILACKYHGWSYGLSGKLAKAPRFETMPSFDKESNALFKVHTHVDARGFVWVNLEAADKPSIPWGVDFEGSDKQQRLGQFNMDEFSFDHAWDMAGDYNWKTLVDNYNECYHCSVAHPGIAATSDLKDYNVEVTGGQIQHFVKDKPGHESGLNAAPTFLFPNASVTMTTKYFYLMRVVPTSPTTTSMQYEVYRHKDATNEEFEVVDEFFKQVESEDKGLCNAAQKNLNAGTYVSGNLHSSNEKGVLYFQKRVKETVMEHRAQEQKVGGEIWPTRRTPSNDNGTEGSKIEW